MKINGVWGEAPSKVAGAAAPDNKPGTDAGLVCQKALLDAEPTKHTQPFNEGKGLGLQARMPESERQKRIRTMRHRALTKG